MGLRDVVAQSVQDREAVRVDVAPVDDVEGGQPGQRFERVDRVSAAEDDHGVDGEGERQIGDLVLDDEGAGDARRRGGELVGADGQLGEASIAEKPAAEPDIRRLAAEPEASLEVTGLEIDPVYVKLLVKQVGEHGPVPGVSRSSRRGGGPARAAGRCRPRWR
jgi:hypothetical protein